MQANLQAILEAVLEAVLEAILEAVAGALPDSYTGVTHNTYSPLNQVSRDIGPLSLRGSTRFGIVKPRKGIAGPSSRFRRAGGYRAGV